MRTMRPALMLSSTFALLAAAPALAQDGSADAATTQAATGSQAETGAGQREDIIVTAQKREQSLIDVPQSVSVISGATLDNQQATNFQDYLKLVPGLQLNQSTPGFGRLVLRGINTGGVASTVAVYADDTPFGSSTGSTNGAILAGDFDTFDVARVEVLRGPQGTLYGASSLGGVLKFVTVQPDTTKIEARAKGAVEFTRDGEASYLGSAVINLPLADVLAVRASGFYRDLGGFVDSIGTGGADVQQNINDSKSYGGRAALLFRPSDGFSLTLSAYLQNLNNEASSEVDVDPSRGRILYGRLSQSQFVPERSRIRYRVYSGNLDVDLGFADLISVTSYSTLQQRFRSDLTTQFALRATLLGAPNDFLLNQITRVRRFTEEVRLQSGSSNTFEWLLGGYYNRETGLIDQAFSAVTPGTLTPLPLPVLGIARSPARYRELAAFVNATVKFGPMFDLTLGGRYSANKQRSDQSSDGLLAGGPNTLPTARSNEDVFTYSASPKFKLNERASIYARVAKGFRPGGPNVLPPAAPASQRTFRSDSLVSYEAGFKGETADGTFALDIAGFHIDWKNIQVFGVVNGFGTNFNGGKARSDGFEFTTTLRPTAGLVASLNAAVTDAKLKDNTPTQVGGLKGDRLPYTPKYSIGANLDYEWSLGGDLTASVGTSLRSLSRQTATYNNAYRVANGRQRQIPAYEVVDLRAALDFGRFSVEAYGRNLFNSHGLTSFDVPTDIATGAVRSFGSAGIIRPRTIGLAVTAGF